ncbi:VOC family protein [Paraburkholderia kururiensis]|uniref:VOC family protein n=1 Tax=Paraburkholderia kururiensis TaxID=984307 RepID=A0ABZ0WIX7_9BURK|nr:VOC family protein [Paraburkholderia kururiensis]WQD77310.1 VOC family protein [Paraburkholderia kururiensis]
MTLLPDHLVVRVHDLKQTVADFAELGFTILHGGTHADGTTHNALIAFADGSYIELIAFLKEAREHRWWDEQRRTGEGFVDFALLPDSVARAMEATYRRGLFYDGLVPGGRVRPDGTRLEWQIARPTTRDLPFLCGDLTPRFLRVPEGSAREHRNGAAGLASINVAVVDLDKSTARYRALLGDVPVHRATLTGQGVHVATLPIGTTTLVLLSPSGDAHGAAKPDETGNPSALAAELRTHLATRGEGLFGAALRVANASQARALPRRLTHAARLELVTAPSA